MEGYKFKIHWFVATWAIAFVLLIITIVADSPTVICLSLVMYFGIIFYQVWRLSYDNVDSKIQHDVELVLNIFKKKGIDFKQFEK